MKKGWKIALISLGSLLGVVILAVGIALWLVFTPSQLTKIVNKLAGEYVTCETKFGEVDLTLFKTFPDAGLKVSDVYIINPMEGAPGGEVVAYIGSLTVGVDVKKFVKENKVIVHQVLLDDVTANLYIDKEGKSNFDIFPKSEDEDTTSTPFSLDSLPEIDLRKVKITNLDAGLLDEKDGLDATLNAFGLDVKGCLQEGLVDADIDLKADIINLQTTDSVGDTTMSALAEYIKLSLNAKGNMEQVAGKLKLNVPVLSNVDRKAFYDLMGEYADKLSKVFHDEYLTIIKNPVIVPKHLQKDVPGFLRYLNTCCFFPSALIYEFKNRGLFLKDYDKPTPPMLMVVTE